MLREAHLSHFNVKVDGAQAPKAALDALLECVIENSLHLPDVCTLRLHDAGFHWLDASLFAEGRQVQVLAGEGVGRLQPIFWGEVVGLEMDMAAHGVPTLAVRCYDRSHRLHRGRVSRSFVNMKDSDIVAQIGREAGLQVQAQATDVVHEWVLQNNQSNWEFLSERAARCGFRLYLQNQADLHFRRVEDGAEQSVTLDWGKTLRSFRPRLSVASQVDEVIVRGWDPKTKQPIVGHCKRPQGTPAVGDGRDGAEIAHQAFGPARMMVVDRPVHSLTEAENLARSLCDDIGGTFLEAEGLCYGMPHLRPGMMAHVANIGARFSGSYYVTSTTHTYTPAEGYATLFGVSGKRSASLLSLLEGDALSRRAPLGGNIVVGVVTANRDPDGQGRVKIMYPWLTEEHTSFWARTASQMAGSGRGMFNLPEVGDEVLVAFEHGDVSRPYVIGQLWNGKDALPGLHGNPTLGPSSEVNRRGFHSRIGHKLNFDDTAGKGNVTIQTANGHIITVDDANRKVEITTTGGHKFVLDDQNQMIAATTTSGHTVNMSDAASAITMRDNAGDTVTMSLGNVSVNALQMLTLAAPLTNIAGALAVNVTGKLITQAAGLLNTQAAGIQMKVGSSMLVSLASMMVNMESPQIKFNCEPPKSKDGKDKDPHEASDSGEGNGGGEGDNDGFDQGEPWDESTDPDVGDPAAGRDDGDNGIDKTSDEAEPGEPKKEGQEDEKDDKVPTIKGRVAKDAQEDGEPGSEGAAKEGENEEGKKDEEKKFKLKGEVKSEDNYGNTYSTKPNKDDNTDEAHHTGTVKMSVGGEYTVADGSLAGNKDDVVKVGAYEAKLKGNVEYDEAEHKVTAAVGGEVEGSVVRADYKNEIKGDVLDAGVSARADVLRGKAEAGANVEFSKEGVEAHAAAGAQIDIIHGEAQAKVGWHIPFTDHTITLTGGVEGGVGAGAQAEGHFDAGKKWNLGGSVNAKAGVGGGFSFNIGFE